MTLTTTFTVTLSSIGLTEILLGKVGDNIQHKTSQAEGINYFSHSLFYNR